MKVCVVSATVVILGCLLATLVDGHGAPPLSPHYRWLQGDNNNNGGQGPKVVVVADGGQTTGGPFAFSRDIYAPGGDLFATANGRLAVLQGIPLTIEFVLYSVNATTLETSPLENAKVYLWQADAVGVYSFVDSMGTENETWLRAWAKSDANGTAVFQTILPGWYPGRAIHWHFRVRLYEQENYYVTSQLFVADEFLQSYNDHGIYAQNTGSQTPNGNDGVFRGLGDVATDLILSFKGDNESGYTAIFHLGIDAGDAGVPFTVVPPTPGDGAGQTDEEEEKENGGAESSSSGAPTGPSVGSSLSLYILSSLLSSVLLFLL